MKAWVLKNLDYVSWDRVGLWLSFLCALHCIVTPLIILSIPFIARYYLAHPLVHLFLAILIFPVGLIAFVSGFLHHRKKLILALGVPGVLIVAFVPYLVHGLSLPLDEPILMILGSVLLMAAHWGNLKACRNCAIHHHSI